MNLGPASIGTPVATPAPTKAKLMRSRAQLRDDLAFFRWAIELDRFPTVGQTMKRFRIEEQAAQVLIDVLRETYGLPVANSPKSEQQDGQG